MPFLCRDHDGASERHYLEGSSSISERSRADEPRRFHSLARRLRAALQGVTPFTGVRKTSAGDSRSQVPLFLAGVGRIAPLLRMSSLSIPDHAPLRPCPFCGRAASVAAHRAATDQPVRYSVGCWEEPSPSARTPHWNDCLGLQNDWMTDLGEAVRLWNRRDQGGAA